MTLEVSQTPIGQIFQPKIGKKSAAKNRRQVIWRAFSANPIGSPRGVCLFLNRDASSREEAGASRARSTSDDDRARAAHCARREAHGRKGVRVLGRDDDDDDDVDRDDDGEREGPRRVLPASRARSPVGTARVATEAEPRSRFVATARAPRRRGPRVEARRRARGGIRRDQEAEDIQRQRR